MSFKSKSPLSMPFADWPEPDRALWQVVLQPDPFAIIPKPLAKWSAVQRQTAARHYGLWLRFLEATEPAPLAQLPGERMTATRLGRYFARRHGEVSVTSLAKYVGDLYGVMLSLAPAQDWAWLKQMRRLVTAHAKHQPPKAKALTHASELLRVGQELIEAAFAGTDKIHDPIAFRDGLIILMLILVPVRITQFSLIRLDQHLVWSEQGEPLLRWEARETKTRREATHPLPPELVEVLRLYISDVRPVLLNKAASPTATNALWIGVSGQPISAQVLRKVIETRTKTTLGYAVNPHAFRASAASSYAIENPTRAREASALLDHADPKTTERYYLLGQRERHLLTVHAALRKMRRHRNNDLATQ